MSSPVILGIDPGFAIIGWAVIDSKLNLLGYGSITTDPKLPFPQRLIEIARDFQNLCATYHPTHLAIEKLFYFKNAKTVINVAQTKGLLLYLAAQNQLTIHQYTPLQVKITITGYGQASKNQVQTMTTRLFKLDKPPKPDDVADALAVAYTHLIHSKNPRAKAQKLL